MFCAICADPPPPSAKNSSAPGARSWTISNIAVPSLPLLLPPQARLNAPPACPGRMMTWAGTSPVSCCSASVSTPSEITPTPMPVPSTSCVLRATFARTLTEITLLCAERPKPQKTGSAWMHLATLYRSWSPVGGVTLARIDLVTRRGRRRVESAGGGQGPPLRPGARLVRRPDPLHVRELGERLEAGQRQPGPDGAVARNAVDDGAAEVANARENRRRHIRPDVHQHPRGGRLGGAGGPAAAAAPCARRSELILRCAGVRAAFAASNAAICGAARCGGAAVVSAGRAWARAGAEGGRRLDTGSSGAIGGGGGAGVQSSSRTLHAPSVGRPGGSWVDLAAHALATKIAATGINTSARLISTGTDRDPLDDACDRGVSSAYSSAASATRSSIRCAARITVAPPVTTGSV